MRGDLEFLRYFFHLLFIDIIFYISTPPIRKDLFRRNVWNGLISQKRLEWTYFAKAFGKELFRERVRKGLISGKRLKRTYSKTNFRRLSWARLNNL